MTGRNSILKLIIVVMGLCFVFGYEVSNASETTPSAVTTIKSDKAVPEQVQVIWRNGFEPCTEKGIDTSEALNGLKIVFKDDPLGSALYILACGGPGYNRPYVAIALDGKRDIAQRVAFPNVRADGVGGEMIVYNIKWDNAKMQLSSFGKDRGLGDCGTKSTWKWAYPQFNSQFVLVDQKTKFDCDGKIDNYPTIWPPKHWPPKVLSAE